MILVSSLPYISLSLEWVFFLWEGVFLCPEILKLLFYCRNNRSFAHFESVIFFYRWVPYKKPSSRPKYCCCFHIQDSGLFVHLPSRMDAHIFRIR